MDDPERHLTPLLFVAGCRCLRLLRRQPFPLPLKEKHSRYTTVYASGVYQNSAFLPNPHTWSSYINIMKKTGFSWERFLGGMLAFRRNRFSVIPLRRAFLRLFVDLHSADVQHPFLTKLHDQLIKRVVFIKQLLIVHLRSLLVVLLTDRHPVTSPNKR